MSPNSPYSHIIISLNNLSYNRYEEFKALLFLRDANIEEIWDHHPKVDGHFDPNSMTDEIAVLEPYIIIYHLKSQGYEESQIEIIYDTSLFIHNEKLYEIEDEKIQEIDLEKLLFFSLRESWFHPFYALLDSLLTSKGGKLHKPNKATMENVGCMNKFYCIKALYAHNKREEFLGDIIIPYNIAKKHYPLFLSYIKEHLGDSIVLKQDCIQEGNGVYVKNTDDDTIIPLLNSHKSKNRELFITPLQEIEAEYRIYFSKSTPQAKQSKIFSIKQRINTTETSELLTKTNLKIYQNIEVEWKLIPKESDEHTKASHIAKEILEYLPYRFGALEFAITKENKIVLFEVNQMAGILPFKGEDVRDITEWYGEMVGE